MAAIFGAIGLIFMFIGGGVVWNAHRSGETRMAFWAGLVFASGLIAFVAAPKSYGTFDRDCIEYSRFADNC